MGRLRHLLMLWGITFGMTAIIIMSWTFFSAYFHPAKQVMVTVNSVGEADFEFFLFCLGPLAIIGLFLFIFPLADGVLDE